MAQTGSDWAACCAPPARSWSEEGARLWPAKVDSGWCADRRGLGQPEMVGDETVIIWKDCTVRSVARIPQGLPGQTERRGSTGCS